MSVFEPTDYVPSTDPHILSGLLLDTEGTITQAAIAADARGSHLAAMYAALDVRTVDAVRCPNDLDCWLDDEGAINGSERNDSLTGTIAILNSGVAQPYFGRGLFLSSNDDGETLSLTPVQAARVVTARETAQFLFGV